MSTKYVTKRNENICPPNLVHKAALFIIAKKQEELKCPLTDEWINEM